ncbi:TcmI family type II polyketide cyclase [Micromonospora rubida]|uniref:TcmI family type II polyketide cyclase n=1 Tax=Micromonospora rubida TaxID=2697657 RepID=UPI0013773AE6|nr:TcmI family type II polyketide cyclase [Micromonospora rubida]NBE84924.1 TcmI family type II polyketide cyclase [Micromonospora rubida]
MIYRSVIVCHIVPGSEGIVGDVFGYYDKTTRPQDLGVIGRTLLSLDDLYIHVIERNVDPKASLGKARGLPAFQQIAEAIAPYVTPYPKNWQNPSDSVAKEFYSWAPAEGSVPASESDDGNMTVIVARIKPGAEPNVARVFAESDEGSLPVELGVTGRWLYSIDDVYLHLLERTDAAFAQAMRESHAKPAFAKIMEDLNTFITPYNPETWRGPEDAVAKEFYRWRAED